MDKNDLRLSDSLTGVELDFKDITRMVMVMAALAPFALEHHIANLSEKDKAAYRLTHAKCKSLVVS